MTDQLVAPEIEVHESSKADFVWAAADDAELDLPHAGTHRSRHFAPTPFAVRVTPDRVLVEPRGGVQQAPGAEVPKPSLNPVFLTDVPILIIEREVVPVGGSDPVPTAFVEVIEPKFLPGFRAAKFGPTWKLDTVATTVMVSVLKFAMFDVAAILAVRSGTIEEGFVLVVKSDCCGGDERDIARPCYRGLSFWL